ncbi:MAG: HNH endonuclease [Candidatus Hadarchaeum sp.]
MRAEKHGRYLQVQFKVDGKNYYVHAHRVVYLALVGDIPDGMEINHKDGNKHNNHPANLECVTKSQNALHAARVLGLNRGENHGRATLTDEAVRQIRLLRRKGVALDKLAEMFGTTKTNICHIVAGRTWKHVEA